MCTVIMMPPGKKNGLGNQYIIDMDRHYSDEVCPLSSINSTFHIYKH